MSSVETSSNVQVITIEYQEFIGPFVEKLQRFCHIKGYTFGSISERLLWNCSFTEQRADDECAQVNITFTYDPSSGCFMGDADIKRIFFVIGGYDFEWKTNYKRDDLDETVLLSFFVNVDAYVEVPFERLVDNEFITFKYETERKEIFPDYRMRELLKSLKEPYWYIDWKISRKGVYDQYESEGAFVCDRKFYEKYIYGRIYLNYCQEGFEVYGNFERRQYAQGSKPTIIFDITIKRQMIRSINRMTKFIKGYLYPLLSLTTGDIEMTRKKVERRYENFERIIQSVHAPQQHESDGDGGGGGGESKGTASQMTTVASILETIHERVSKLEVDH